MLTRLHDRLGLRTSPQIFFISALIIILFTAAMALFPTQVQGAFGVVASFLRYEVGWFYTGSVTLLLIIALVVAFSRYGRARLGDDDARPEHSGIAWFGMLFAAGVGAVLMFWGVAEPMNHYANAPMYGTEDFSDRAAMEASGIANFHFGLHMWAILVVPGLCFGYFTYKRKLPPRVSSAFQPLLGDGIHGPIGRAIDIMAIVATVFGLSVSVGLGALQINSGMNIVMGVPVAGWVQALILAVITAVGLASVMAGMDKGVKRLSYVNIVAAVALLVFVLMFGASMDIMRGIVETAGQYVAQLPVLSFFNDTFGGGDWSGDWTVFYWAWTVTWAPFVGMFIAKISRGRTIREFVLAALGLPTLFVIIWMAIYGLSGIWIDRASAPAPGTGGALTETIVEQGDVQAALFQFLESFPFSAVTSIFALLVITVFFITSIDSGALVMDAMANGHEDEGPRRQRVFWALSIGAVCSSIVLTSGEGGLGALQEVIIVVGLPVMVLSLLQALMLVQALREDAGAAKPLRTRQWKQVLPAEEYHRRAQEDSSAVDAFVIRPEYEVGTEPEYDTHQPQTWHWQQTRSDMPRLTIGLTGAVAAGKTVAREELAALGATVIDADAVARGVMEPGSAALSQIREVFGPEVITPHGVLDRAALGRIVFGSTTARDRLNEIVHPPIRERIERQARAAGSESIVVVDAPLLVETEQAGQFDVVLDIEAPAEELVQRLIEHRGLSREEAWERIDARAGKAERAAQADVVIHNDGDLESLRAAVREFWDQHVVPVLDEQDARAAEDRAAAEGAAPVSGAGSTSTAVSTGTETKETGR